MGLLGPTWSRLVLQGEVIEDYGDRALLLEALRQRMRCRHIVFRVFPQIGCSNRGCYCLYPDAKEWEPNWKKRRRKRRR